MRREIEPHFLHYAEKNNCCLQLAANIERLEIKYKKK